jgi:23S rRNA pseudouridine1911/1915/1917 synthase
MKKLPRDSGGRSGKQGRVSNREDRRQTRFSRELVVLYEDDAIVALDKPAGLAAVPVRGSDAPSAWSLLSAALKRKRQRAFVVHRIDRFTSGILLFAKTESDRDILVRQFLRHTPLREYLAVVRGRLGVSEAKLVHYFRRDGMFQKLRTQTDPKAARAELRYSVERPLLGATLVRVALATGLQNQIRVQFSAIGHPVVGDRKYHLDVRQSLGQTAAGFQEPARRRQALGRKHGSALREIRMALLEADVNFRVVKQLIENIKQKAMGEEVLTALSPSQQVVKIVHEELIKILGSHESKLRFANEPPSVFLIVGCRVRAKPPPRASWRAGFRATGTGR